MEIMGSTGLAWMTSVVGSPFLVLGQAGVCSEGNKSSKERDNGWGGQADGCPLRSHQKGDLWADDGNLNPQRRIGNVAPDLNYWIFLWLNLISQQNFPFFLIIAWFL